MEYSVQAYIKKQSTEVLEHFLQQCSQPDRTDNYDHIIPDIQNELENRKP